MRITFVLPHAGLAGGIRVAAIHAQELHRRGHHVTAISLPLRRPDFRSRMRQFLRLGAWPVTQPEALGHFTDVPFEHRVIETHRPISPQDVPDADVVIGTWWETATWISNFPAKKGAKVHFIQHDETQFDHQEENYRERVEVIWKLPTRKIVVAGWLKNLAAARYGVTNVTVVPNGVDTDMFHASPRTKRWPVSVGLMYATSNFKGTDISLEAVRLARQAFPRLRFVAFGAHQPIDEMPVPHPAEFHVAPEQDKLREIYASCDAWLFGSRSEGFGLPVLEAMACRTPVIGTPTGVAPDVLKDGAGIFVKPQDPLDMARAIERVCRMDEADWKRMSDKAYTVARRHTWKRSFDLFEAELEKAIAAQSVAA